MRPTPQTVQQNFAAVSGANGGEECTNYADCTALLDEGSEIRYTGPSGIGPIDEENDPSSAFVGIYTFNDEQQERADRHGRGPEAVLTP